MATDPKALNKAIDAVPAAIAAIAKKFGVSPVELIVYATAAQLLTHFTPEDAVTQFVEATANLKKAGFEKA